MKKSGILILLFSGEFVFAQNRQAINPNQLPPVSKTYSQAVAVQGGRTIYVSGQVSVSSKGEVLYKNDLYKQTEQALENLKLVLAASGARFEDIVKTTTFVVNSDDEKIKTAREVRAKYFTSGQPPASTYVGVQALYNADVMIEIEAVAVVK
jgi:2-iminobutanoate/2-iminopropanoate deaminase